MTGEAQIPALHEPDRMGVWRENGETIWLPRSLYPTRASARTFCLSEADWPCAWIEVRVLARWMRHAPERDEWNEYGGEYWIECGRDEPGAFRVWRCE